MNKLIFLIISFLFIVCSNCFGQKKKNNDLMNYHLKGNVKSLRSVPYHVTNRNGKLQKGAIYDELSVDLENHTIYKFNRLGYITKWGYIFGDKTTFTNYTYDSSNNLIKSTNNGSTLWPKTLYVYDSIGNKIEEQNIRSDGSISSKDIFKYNNKSQKILDYSDYNDGKEHFKHTYKYNDEGICTQKDYYGQDGRLKSKCFFKYDSLGQHISTSFFDSAGNLQRKLIFEYNANGNISKDSIFDFRTNQFDVKINAHNYDYQKSRDATSKHNIIVNQRHRSGLLKVRTYEYKYDNQDNWIQRVEYQNGQPEMIVERKIKYYK